MNVQAVTEEAQPRPIDDLGAWCRMSGITYRQLDHWARTRVLRPANGHAPGFGHPREWTEAELAVAVMVGRLTGAGLELHAAAKAARALCAGAESADLAPGVTLSVSAAELPLAGAA